MEWKDISTAPKDGTDILVYFDFATVPIVHIAWWKRKEDHPDFTEEDVGWWSYTNNSVSQSKLEGFHTPTHWMPFNEPEKLTDAF